MNTNVKAVDSLDLRNPKIIIRRLRKAYDAFSFDFSKTRQSNLWKEVEIFLKYELLKNNTSSIIDIGCGNGRYLKYVRALSKDALLIGIDFSKNMIKEAIKNESSAHYIIAEMQNLPIKNKSIQSAIAIASIHHLPSKTARIKAINELIRITNKSILISVWYYYQEKFKNKPKDLNLMWRKKYFRYYHLYDFSDIYEETKHLLSKAKIFSFLDHKKQNIYIEISLKNQAR